MANGGFVTYYRVSTERQGRSGLGLEAQRHAVASFLNGGDWRIVAEFTEVESGKRSDRPVLQRALAAARVHRVPLVVAKLDRLSRDAGFLMSLDKAGVDFMCCDNPHANRLTIGVLAVVADEERRMISARTKAALAAAKARGVKLGGHRGSTLSAEAIAAGRAAQTERAAARSADLAPIVAELRAAGASSLAALAKGLNDRGIPTARGTGVWQPAQVSRLLKAAGVWA